MVSAKTSPVIPILQGLEETEDNTGEVDPNGWNTEHKAANNDG